MRLTGIVSAVGANLGESSDGARCGCILSASQFHGSHTPSSLVFAWHSPNFHYGSDRTCDVNVLFQEADTKTQGM